MKYLSVDGNCHIFCRSAFYTTLDYLSSKKELDFTSKFNFLRGEIDSGNWALSYLLSMYCFRPKDCIFVVQPQIILDGQKTSFEALKQISCYMDTIYPLFSGKRPIKKYIELGIKNSGLQRDAEEIRELFCIDKERFARPLSAVGNEKYKAMAAIAYVNKKELFCFPWMSRARFMYYHKNLTELLNLLETENKKMIFPIGISE